MKTIRCCSLLTAAFATLWLAGSATESKPAPSSTESTASASRNEDSENADRLWIAVHLPNVTKASWVSDDMAEMFADKIIVELRAHGYKGKIGTLRPEDSTSSHASVLIVRLADWTAKDGIAVCRCSASLRTREGDRELGSFEGDNMIVTADGEHRISSDGLIGSAQEALNDLYSRIKATGLFKTD